MIRKRVKFPSGDLILEGELQSPEGKGSFPAVVVCHPHPLYGGDMDNNVVTSVCDALTRKSIAALRFNFRGVGKSSGEYGEGSGEQDDAKAALDYISSLNQIDGGKIGLAGYSFGGFVAAAVAFQDVRVKKLALISPYLDKIGWTTLKRYGLPKLVLLGDKDDVLPFRQFQHLFGAPNEYLIIIGADHSWTGFENQVGGKIAAFFSDRF